MYVTRNIDWLTVLESENKNKIEDKSIKLINGVLNKKVRV